MGSVMDVVVGALTSCGQLGQGQTPSPEDGALGLRLINLGLSSTSAQRLYLFYVATRTYTLVASTADYTIGPTGTLGGVQVRPTFIESAQINTLGDAWPAMSVLDKPKWDAVVNKGAIADVPEVCYPEYSYPNIGMHINPAPKTGLSIRLGCWEPLHQFLNLFEQIGGFYPAEYEEWIEADLAIRFTPFYDQPITPAMQDRYAKATAAVQSKNAQGMVGALSAANAFQSPNLGQPIPTGTPAAQ